MSDLTTSYLGLPLANPLVPSSSPLTGDFDTARRMEDLGAAALVLPSLFEEEWVAEAHQMVRFLDHQAIGHPEADSFLPTSGTYCSMLDHYLERVQRYKAALNIPVIGSLNGVTDSGWLEQAAQLEQAGCDALEINLYDVVSDPLRSSDDVERTYLRIVHHVVDEVSIPVTVKLCSQITALAHFVTRLEAAGAKGVVCFNRFYQPDIDLESLHLNPRVHLSASHESWQRIRWIGLLRPHVQMSLAVTGGFHDFRDAAKALLAGADVIHLCSALLQEGVEVLPRILTELSQWMDEREYASLNQLRGSLSALNAINPEAYSRANYIRVLDSYSAAPGVKQ